MDISTIKLTYFSPTNTTKQVLSAIAEGVGTGDLEHINLTLPESGTKTFSEFNNELVILGSPVYAGRMPAEAVKRISRLKGNNTPAIVVVVYGNREFEDALLELRDLAAKSGFIPIAGGAFIGEHSYTSPESPIAVGRPDSQDIQKAEEFGKAIKQKMESIKDIEDEEPIVVPGNFPYKDGMPSSDESAETIEEHCQFCGLCADVCPTAAITMIDRVITDPEQCILCCACVKSCPSGARVIASPRIKGVARWLSENYSTPKQPVTFI